MSNVFETAKALGLKTIASRVCGIDLNANGTMPCPLHSEKVGKSFSVKDDQFWKCFGKCGTHGDSVEFVAQYKKIESFDAAKLICETFGLTYELKKSDVIIPEIDYSFLLGNDFIARTASLGLMDNPAVLHYLKDVRKFSDATLEKFMFGYISRDIYEQMAELVTRKKISEENYKAFSRHVGRLVIPLHNSNGKQVLGFVSRALSKTDTIKYINDNDSAYQAGYHKKIYSYGVFASTRHTDVVIVEGYLDGPSLIQMGINTVAMGDCSLPEPRFNYLSTMYKKLILGLDNDLTGVYRTMESYKRYKSINFGFVIWPIGIKDANDSLIKGVPLTYGDYFEYIKNVWANNINDIKTDYAHRIEFIDHLRDSLSFTDYGDENYFVRREIDKWTESILDS